MDIVSIIMNQLGNQDNLDSVARKTNTSTSTVQKIAQMGLPMIMDGLNKRTSQDSEASKELAEKASRHTNDDMDHLNNYLDKTDETEGNRLLDMAFGSDEQEVEKRIADKTGTETSKVKSVLTMLAPLALSMLAKRGSSGQGLSGSGVSQLLGGLTDGVKQQSQSSGYGDILSSVFGNEGSSTDGKKQSSNENNTLDKAKDTIGKLFEK